MKYLYIIFCVFCAHLSETLAQNKINKVLILGNSITIHSPKPAIGWDGNWGMAASVQEKDYVHVLKSKMLKINPEIEINFGNIASSFEKKFWDMDTVKLDKYKSIQPDLLILVIGENIVDTLAIKNDLDKYLVKLVNFILDSAKANVLMVGSFWPNKNINTIMQKTCTNNHWLYSDLDGLYKNREQNTAILIHKNAGVARHPSDIGMAEIADRIWLKIHPLFK